jgi:hypothetical protein
MNNPFGNFKFNQYQEQFSPLPARDILAASGKLHEQGQMNRALQDKLEQQMNSVNVFDEDAYVKQAQLEEFNRAYEEIEKSGAWEHAGKLSREVARNFVNNKQLNSASSNYKAYQELIKEANEMDVSDYQLNKLKALRSRYGSVGSADEFGKYNNIGSVNFYEEKDIMGDVFDRLAKKKADKSVVPYSEGYWLVKETNEIRSEKELLEDGINYVMNDPQYKTQMRDMAMNRATGGDLNKEITNEEYSKAYNDIAYGLIAPSAGILEYNHRDLDFKADPIKVDGIKRAKDQVASGMVGTSEIMPTEQPTFEDNLKETKASDARLKQLLSERVDGVVNKDLEDDIIAEQLNNETLTKNINQELETITNEMNEAYGLEGNNKITTEIYKDMMANYDDKTSGSNFLGRLKDYAGVILKSTPAGIASGQSSAAAAKFDAEGNSSKEYYTTKFTESQRNAFDEYHGKFKPFKRTSQTRKGKYEEAKTTSKNFEIVYFNKKESNNFAPYIMEEAMKGGAVNNKGKEYSAEELKNYSIDNKRNIGLASGEGYIQVPIIDSEGNTETIFVDGNQITSDGATLYTHGKGLLQNRKESIQQNMQYLNEYEKREAKTFINASEPILNPDANKYTNFIEKTNNLNPRTQTVKGQTTGLVSYGSNETGIGNTGFVRMDRVGDSGTQIYLGSKDDQGNEYVFSYEDNQGNDRYGKQNGIVKGYLNTEGAGNPQTNTNNALKGKRMANIDKSIKTFDQMPTESNVSNFHVMSKLSEYSRGKDVYLSDADVEQLEEINAHLETTLESQGLNINIPELDINNKSSLEGIVSSYNQVLQLISEGYDR